jgi:excinuclease ABC subunit C
VAACVVFKDGKPSKKDYRHFNIKTVEGPDDFASMTELFIVAIRGLFEEKSATIIIIDGGKGNCRRRLKVLMS